MDKTFLDIRNNVMAVCKEFLSNLHHKRKTREGPPVMFFQYTVIVNECLFLLFPNNSKIFLRIIAGLANTCPH